MEKHTFRAEIPSRISSLKNKIYSSVFIWNYFRLYVFFSFIATSGISGQDTDNIVRPLIRDIAKPYNSLNRSGNRPGFNVRSIEEYTRLNQAQLKEKIFLHIDRPDYIPGDTIWVKAYSWCGSEQVPDTLSKILYIDLLNQEDEIIQSRRLLIQGGLSMGDFNLDSSLSPGRYTLRAYTRWMQNINAGEPFYQTITINPANQICHAECMPVIMRHPGNDSLGIGFRYFEIDPSGDLNSSFNHIVKYSIKIGDQMLDTGQLMVANSTEQFIKCSLAGITEYDSVGIFRISIHDNDISFEKHFQIHLKEGIDIQFFPEGGKLVNGLYSKVAFKAIGTDGLSREVNGVIETGEGEVVTHFASTHKGMGTFMLRPDADKEYFAHLWYNNRKYIVPLPPAEKNGCIMSVHFTGNDNDPYLTIKQNHPGGNFQKIVTGNAYGKIWFSNIVNLSGDSCRIRIPSELLPEGVCRLTVLDNNFKPESERLIYVNKNQRFKISVIPDSSSFETRSKVTLLIKTTRSGEVPVQTDMSLAVVDKELVNNKDAEVTGICDYKLLESELRGYIEDIGFYFKDDSCINYSKLDLLLLTQGYRSFLQDNAYPDEQNIRPEKDFDISGKIKFSGSKSRENKFKYNDVDLILLFQSSAVSFLDQSNPDSLGRFRFKIPLFYGQSHSLIQATSSKGKPLYGEIIINDTLSPPGFTTPIPEHFLIVPSVIENVHRSRAVQKTENSKIPSYGEWTLSLPEITVKARAKNWYRDFENNAIKIVDLDSLDPDGNKYETISDLLIREFGATQQILPHGIKTIFLPCVSIWKDYWYPIYVVDGNTYFNGAEQGEAFLRWLEMILYLRVNEIKRIMVLPPGAVANYYADMNLSMLLKQSLVVIETYYDRPFRGDPRGIKNFILDGLDAPRAFYSPRYEGPSKKSPIYDGRATLFWTPSIRTDTNGQAVIEFYTSDRKTTLEVTINGIAVETGHPGQKQILIKQ